MDEDEPSSKKILENPENTLRAEWQLFWDALFGPTSQLHFEEKTQGLEQDLSLDNIRLITKNLSQTRRKLNQELEKIKSEIEQKSQLLENLKVVGSPIEETLARIHELNELGQNTSQKLEDLSGRLKRARKIEDQLKKTL